MTVETVDRNTDADWLYNFGNNSLPMNTDTKIPPVGEGEMEPWLHKPMPIASLEHFKRNNKYDTGIASTTGTIWRGVMKGRNFYGIDADSREANLKIRTFNGMVLTDEELNEKDVYVQSHGGDSYHYYVTTDGDKTFPNVRPNKTGIEIKGKNKWINMFGNGWKWIGKDPTTLDKDYVWQSRQDFMQHIFNVLDKNGVQYEGKVNYKPVTINKEKIPNGQRHDTAVSKANSLIARLHKTDNRETIWKYFVTWVNEEFEHPWGSEVSEKTRRDELREMKQIFDDAWNERVTKNTNSQSNQQENNNDTTGKILSVIEAKRLHSGNVTVGGTIVSVSDMYVLEIKDNGETEYRNAKSILLEDTEKLDENERLDVVLYDDKIDNVAAGEIVQIAGKISIEVKKPNNKSKKKYNVLHAKSITYLNRKEILVTDRNIESFEKFASYPQLLDRLTAMYAPYIIGHDDVKRGLLRSIVGGVNRGKKSDGRISTLEVGDPGTAKSKLGAEATEIKPNSRHVSAPHATTKTITAIVEKVNDNISLSLGAIPLSKGAICAIDEINMFPMEDQSRLLDVLEEGVINLDKMGRRYVIPAATTIIATANPIGGKWNNNQVATKEEIELKKSLMDRFPQIYTFRDSMDENQTNDFVKEMSAIRRRKPHKNKFLRKYLIHASNIKDVTFTKSAEWKLNQFWAKAKAKGLLSIRMYYGLFKIAEAQAKLQLRNIVDDEIVDQVIEDVQLMMIQYGETVEQFIGPHELALNTFLEVLRETHSPMTLESICERAIKKNDRIGDYIGWIWTPTTSNWKLRNVVDSLLNRRDVIRTQEKPFLLQYLCDGCDVCEGKNKKISENEDEI